MTSSPHYPLSNGFVERQIQTVTAGVTRIDMAMALLVLRSTLIDSYLPSPAELLYTRKLKANMPVRIRDTRQNRDDIRQR